MSQSHPDYSKLAARITASNLQKLTPKTFSQAVEQMYKVRAGLGEVASGVVGNVPDVYGRLEGVSDLRWCFFGVTQGRAIGTQH